MKFDKDIHLEFEHFIGVKDTFYRAVDPAYRQHVIDGSRFAGRYSSADQPTLYLSASIEGVKVAIGAHKKNRVEKQEVVKVLVEGTRILDLRDEAARLAAQIEINDATHPWQPLVAKGDRPPSWSVRDRVIELGGKGLIDPSRQQPGLWHLVLFEWNQEDAPCVEVID